MSEKTWFVAAILLVSFFVGCGPSEEEAAGDAQAEGWAALQEEHAGLAALREELAATRAEVAAGPEGDEDTGLSPEEHAMQLEEKAAGQESVINERADEFSRKLVEFINEHAGFEGDAVDDIQSMAIRLKSDEDIELAREYVIKGGDYKRALDILGNASAVDPEYARLKEALAELEDLRYMDDARFSQVEKGMTEQQVRDLLGQVNHSNLRPYPERDVVAWFYPKEEGAASAVYFRENRGRLLVYDTDFNAVKTALERAE